MNTPSREVTEQAKHYLRVLDKTKVRFQASPAQVVPKTNIEAEIAREQKIKNDNAEQDIALKRVTLTILFIFLATETALIFLFATFQALRWPANFHLEEWSFKLLVAATISQITAMLFAAVRYLFPKHGK